MTNKLEDDSKEEWVVELCLVVTKPIKEAEEEEAMLPVLKEIKEKKPKSMGGGGHSRKDQFMVLMNYNLLKMKVSQNRNPIPSMQM